MMPREYFVNPLTSKTLDVKRFTEYLVNLLTSKTLDVKGFTKYQWKNKHILKYFEQNSSLFEYIVFGCENDFLHIFDPQT